MELNEPIVYLDRIKYTLLDLKSWIDKIDQRTTKHKLNEKSISELSDIKRQISESIGELIEKNKTVIPLKSLTDIEDRFKCPICTSILISPIQIECGCRFCKSCYTSSSKLSSTDLCFYCNDYLSDATKINDKLMEKELNGMEYNLTYADIENMVLKKQTIATSINENDKDAEIKNNENIEIISENDNVTITKNEKDISELMSQMTNRISTESNTLINYDNASVLWIINDIKTKITEAQSNQTTQSVIVSKQFYLKKPGYNYSLKLYLLGDGKGINTHLSVFFTINLGDFDDQLQWPFTQVVKLDILDKTKNKFKHRIKVDSRDPNVQKPSNDSVHIGIGQPKFLPLKYILNNENYTNDSSLVLCFSESVKFARFSKFIQF